MEESKDCNVDIDIDIQFGLGKKVSVSENLVSERKSRFRFRKIWSRKKSLGFGFGKIWSRKKVLVSVSENLVSEKKSRFRKIWYRKKSLVIGFRKFGIRKKVSVSVLVKILVSSFSAHRQIFYVWPASRTPKPSFLNINMAAIYEKCHLGPNFITISYELEINFPLIFSARDIGKSFMRIRCSEVPKRICPSLLWLTEWKSQTLWDEPQKMTLPRKKNLGSVQQESCSPRCKVIYTLKKSQSQNKKNYVPKFCSLSKNVGLWAKIAIFG